MAARTGATESAKWVVTWRQVVARAVTWHAVHRVLLNGNRTVILL
jgi:formyltetrahydrofolate hydrolase